MRSFNVTWRQMLGVPFILGVPIVALFGVFGGDRAGIVARVALVYGFVLTCFRVLGKRELTQNSPLEIVTLFLIPQLFRNAIMRNDDTMIGAIVGALTLFGLAFLTSLLTYHAAPVRRVFQAEPSTLLTDGTLDESALDRERVTPAEVMAAARKAGLDGIAGVASATLEADGRISVVPRTVRSTVP